MTVLKIALNKWFRLPQLGREVFSDLLKSRVKYDSKFGFQFTQATNISRAIAILSSALDEDIEFSKNCFICDNTLGDDDLPEATVCSQCIRNDDALDLYTMKFARLMEGILE